MLDFVKMAEHHRDADMLEGGSFEMIDGKACSVGCFCHDLGLAPNDFAGLARETGYPEWVHHLQEAVFEGLPEDKRADWHVDLFRKAASVKDWAAVYHQTMIGILKVALPHDTSPGQIVQRVIDLHKRGPDVTAKERGSARAAARGYAGAAARAAAWAAARAAAWAAGAAAWAAGAAARDAARAAAWAAGDAAWAAGAAGAAVRDAAWQDIAQAFLKAEG